MDTKNTVVDRKSETTSAKPAPAAPASETATAKTAQDAAPVEQDAPLVTGLAEILATSKSRGGGTKIRPNVGYTLVVANLPKLANTSVPEQEQVVLRLLQKALTVKKPVISEPEIEKLIVAAKQSGALKTKQDAFHIFRYYRTDLVKRGVLKQVDMPAAA